MPVAVLHTNECCSHSIQHYEYIQTNNATCFG